VDTTGKPYDVIQVSGFSAATTTNSTMKIDGTTGDLLITSAASALSPEFALAAGQATAVVINARSAPLVQLAEIDANARVRMVDAVGRAVDTVVTAVNPVSRIIEVAGEVAPSVLRLKDGDAVVVPQEGAPNSP
jgi:hypothetical protein